MNFSSTLLLFLLALIYCVLADIGAPRQCPLRPVYFVNPLDCESKGRGYQLDTKTGLCEKRTCDQGFTKIEGACIPECDYGEVRNTQGSCYTPRCPAGYVRIMKCLVRMSGRCTLRTREGRCIGHEPGRCLLKGRPCTKLPCVYGSERRDKYSGKCVPRKKCPKGKHFYFHTCRHTCPKEFYLRKWPGMPIENERSYYCARHRCPPHFRPNYKTRRCVPRICPPSFHLVFGECKPGCGNLQKRCFSTCDPFYHKDKARFHRCKVKCKEAHWRCKGAKRKGCYAQKRYCRINCKRNNPNKKERLACSQKCLSGYKKCAQRCKWSCKTPKCLSAHKACHASCESVWSQHCLSCRAACTGNLCMRKCDAPNVCGSQRPAYANCRLSCNKTLQRCQNKVCGLRPRWKCWNNSLPYASAGSFPAWPQHYH